MKGKKEKYRIGDISKLTGIPVQTLRFYEEKKLLNPVKDPKSGYRYYDAWGVNDLMDVMFYRKMGFSLEQIERHMNSSNLEEQTEELMEQENKIMDEIEQRYSMLQAVSSIRIGLQTFQHQIGRFQPCMSPSLVYQRHQKLSTFQTPGGSEDLKELNEKITPWTQAMPESRVTFSIPFHTLEPDKKEEVVCWWGFSMPYSEAIKHNLYPVSPNEHLPSTYCLYTIFAAGQEGTFTTAFHQDVYKKIFDAGYVVNGNPYGRVIAKIHEDGVFKRFFEVWVPVQR